MLSALLILSAISLAAIIVGVIHLDNVFSNTSRERERERNVFHARESELLDRLMHVTGNTWTRPPARENDLDEDEMSAEEIKRIQEGWTSV